MKRRNLRVKAQSVRLKCCPSAETIKPTLILRRPSAGRGADGQVSRLHELMVIVRIRPLVNAIPAWSRVPFSVVIQNSISVSRLTTSGGEGEQSAFARPP